MRKFVTLVSAALFTVAVVGPAFAAPASSIHSFGIVKIEKKPKNNCRRCKTQ